MPCTPPLSVKPVTRLRRLHPLPPYMTIASHSASAAVALRGCAPHRPPALVPGFLVAVGCATDAKAGAAQQRDPTLVLRSTHCASGGQAGGRTSFSFVIDACPRPQAGAGV
ncbi:hypothetical protein K438DRAFT_1992828 [Mycena galopus ATCC 62051]|nr:hypothetical protein K438DRAFT_1992828 [Mycena galopus ATCC 62051]